MNAGSIVLAVCCGLLVSSSLVTAPAAAKDKIVAFYPGSTDTYVGAEIKALKEEAAAAGYDIEVFENGYFNQQNQDQQVQQYLALGEKPSLFLWWPADRDAGLGSLRAIAQLGKPVIIVNQPPSAEAEKYLVAFVGNDDVARSTDDGIMMIEARDKMLQSDHKLHSEWGNAIAATFPSTYSSTKPSLDVFLHSVEPAGIKVLGVSDEGFGAANGYTGVSKLIAQYRDQGIDLVYAMDDQILQGAIKALEEAGYKPGIDVMVVGAVCHGDRRLLDEGKEYATSLQSPTLEAQLTIKVAKEYLTTGKVERRVNLMPCPLVRWNEWRSMRQVDYHGVERTMDQLCPWK